MTDEQAPNEPGVGSVAEEAARLVGALQDWARDNASGPDAGGSPVSAMAAKLAQVNDHVASGADCVYCPVCQVVRAVRETSPEVRAHLATAAGAVLQAAAGILEAKAPTRRAAGVENIDLDT